MYDHIENLLSGNKLIEITYIINFSFLNKLNCVGEVRRE